MRAYWRLLVSLSRLAVLVLFMIASLARWDLHDQILLGVMTLWGETRAERVENLRGRS